MIFFYDFSSFVTLSSLFYKKKVVKKLAFKWGETLGYRDRPMEGNSQFPQETTNFLNLKVLKDGLGIKILNL